VPSVAVVAETPPALIVTPEMAAQVEALRPRPLMLPEPVAG